MKQITIEIPDNMEFDKETMTIREIETPNYNEIAKKLFRGKDAYFIDACGNICKYEVIESYSFPNNCTSRSQAEKLLALNKLMNVAKYLNGDWDPDDLDSKNYKCRIFFDRKNKTIGYTSNNSTLVDSAVYFKNEKLARQAVQILGEETIKTALSTDW